MVIFNYCCEQQGRCGVTLFELLLRAAEPLRCHVVCAVVASSRDVAASFCLNCCCEQQRR